MSGADRIVLFDLGGVMLPFDRERRVRAMAEALGAAPEAIRALVANGVAERLDAGTAGEDDLAQAMSAVANRPVAAEEARRLWLSVFEPPNQRLWDLAVALRGRATVGALSDNPAFVREVFPTEAAFDHVFLSCELGRCKPAPEVFAVVQARLGAPPASVLFIDDSPGNVAAARDAGWDAIHYTSDDQLMDELARRELA